MVYVIVLIQLKLFLTQKITDSMTRWKEQEYRMYVWLMVQKIS